ncbi:NAD(P)H-quinone oxidoreductase subunit T, chloroplastic [Linum grandiflorum]
MAFTAAPYPAPFRARNSGLYIRTTAISGTGTTHRNRYTSVVATAAQEPERGQRAPLGVDTRIHWDNEDQGWVGGTSSTSSHNDIPLGESFADLLKDASDSHYQQRFLGVQPEADLEEIKAGIPEAVQGVASRHNITPS